MQGFEYTVLGGSLLLSVGLLLLCLLRYVLVRAKEVPQYGALSRVEVQHLGWIDLAGVGLVFAIYLGNWIDLGRAKAAEPLSYPLLMSQLVLQFAFIGVVLGVLYRRVRLVDFWGLKPRRYWWAIAVVFSGIVLYFITLEVLWVVGFQDWTKSVFWRAAESGPPSAITSTMVFWVLMGLISVVGAPLMEEIVFRGYLYPVLKRMGGAVLAALTVSLFFAAAHLEGTHLLGRFLLSLLLIFAYEITGTIWAPFGIHFLNNFYAFLENFLE